MWYSGEKEEACWLAARSMQDTLDSYLRTNAVSCTLAQRSMQRPHSRPGKKRWRAWWIRPTGVTSRGGEREGRTYFSCVVRPQDLLLLAQDEYANGYAWHLPRYAK